MKLNYDNKLFQGMAKFVDCVYVSLLWVICCIPVFTFGASTCALYYTVHKSIRGNRDYVGSSFFKAFRENFKQATLSWLVMLGIGIVLVLDAVIMRQMLMAGSKMGVLYYFFLVAVVIVIGWGCMLFPYIARFENTVKNTLKNAFILCIHHLPWSILLLVILAAALLLTYLIPFLIFILPALVFLLYNAVLERIFRKYMSEEDLARELEIERMDKRENM